MFTFKFPPIIIVHNYKFILYSLICKTVFKPEKYFSIMINHRRSYIQELLSWINTERLLIFLIVVQMMRLILKKHIEWIFVWCQKRWQHRKSWYGNFVVSVYAILLVSSKSESGRPNQIGPSNEVAALIVADSNDNCPFRDIVVQTKHMYLKRVFETCKHFMQLQYPLTLPLWWWCFPLEHSATR